MVAQKSSIASSDSEIQTPENMVNLISSSQKYIARKHTPNNISIGEQTNLRTENKAF